MSTIQITVRRTVHPTRAADLGRLAARLWDWWINLYAKAPRKLPPYIL